MVAFQKLQRLDLSFNPLGNGASYPLTACLQQTTSLTSLRLESCDLTDAFLDNHIRPLLRRKQLEEVAIGWNEWSSSATRSWLLDVLDFSSLHRLSLIGGNCGVGEKSVVVNALSAAVQSVDSCRLVKLDLSHCRLTDVCVNQLSQCFEWTPHFKKLILKNNAQLGTDSLSALLIQCREKRILLEELDMLGCALSRSSSSPELPMPCVGALRSFLEWSKSLRVLSLSFSRRRSDPSWINCLADVWLFAHGPEAVSVQPTDYQLLLTISKV